MNRYNNWNPWHGCTKISPGCANCYVYRQDKMFGTGTPSFTAHKNAEFSAPVSRNRLGGYRIPSGALVFTCFTSDFLLKDADEWRGDCWRMMRERSDCMFYFFTKRIDRLPECLPEDWGDGYDNVIIGCTVENNAMANKRLPIFSELKIRHKTVIAAPLLERLELSPYLDSTIEEVSVGGESGSDARICDYDWVLDIRRQCVEKDIPFVFHQTGARFVKDNRLYRIPRRLQREQARKAGINYKAHSVPTGGEQASTQLTFSDLY